MKITEIDLKMAPLEMPRVMIWQRSWSERSWRRADGLHRSTDDGLFNVTLNLIKETVQRENCNAIVLPELSVNDKEVKFLQEAFLDEKIVVVCGSHYREEEGRTFNVAPIIVDSSIYYQYKNYPAPAEYSSIVGKGVSGGDGIYIFRNSIIGDFAVTICADY